MDRHGGEKRLAGYAGDSARTVRLRVAVADVLQRSAEFGPGNAEPASLSLETIGESQEPRIGRTPQANLLRSPFKCLQDFARYVAIPAGVAHESGMPTQLNAEYLLLQSPTLECSPAARGASVDRLDFPPRHQEASDTAATDKEHARQAEVPNLSVI